MKKIAILGSTGSIGTQTLDVVRANGDLEVVASAPEVISHCSSSRSGNFIRSLRQSAMRRKRQNSVTE